MGVGALYAASLFLTALVLAAPTSCAPPQAARLPEDAPAARTGGPATAEDVIREHDLQRLWSLEEYAAEQEQLDAEIALLEREVADADYASQTQTGRTLEHVGRATWSVFVVAFTLGMAALPFLI
jgi:hypothetical protein